MNNQHKKNLHIGSSFDDFLTEEAILEEVTAVATKRVIAWQVSEKSSQWGQTPLIYHSNHNEINGVRLH